jgi:large conductance mechanosensitive channel
MGKEAGMIDGFRKFLLRGNVIDLAVAVVIGAAFTGIVTAIVEGLVTPLIGAVGGIPDFSAWTFTINTSQFQIGRVINAILNFVVIAAVIYFLVVQPMNALMERIKRQEEVEPPAPTVEEKLLTEIRDAIKERPPL